MDAIRSWAIVVCGTLIITTIFSMLVPKGNMQKTMQFAVSLFFVLSLAVPFLTKLPGFQAPQAAAADLSFDQQTEALKTPVEQKLLSLTRSGVERSVEELLAGMKIVPEKISVEVHKEEGQSIGISRARIWLDPCYQDQAGKIQNRLREELAAEPELIFTSDEGGLT